MDVVGVLLGTLDVSEPARVLDLSASGALLESSQPIAIDSTQVVYFTIGSEEIRVDARVRHIRPHDADASGPQRYLIGLEFVSLSTPLLESMGAWRTRSHNPAG
jgi:hypothetical protein